MTDHQLMEAVRAGDRRGVEELVSKYDRRLFRFILSWVHDPEEASDMTQEVLWRVCNKAGSYNSTAPLGSWIFRIARNLLVDRSRRSDLRLVTASIDDDAFPEPPCADADSGPEGLACRGEIRERVKSAIEALPPRQREVVRLRLLADLQLDEIAEILGLSLGGVKSTLHNAIRNLREGLADLETDNYVRQ